MRVLSVLSVALLGITLKSADAQFKGSNIAFGKQTSQLPGDYQAYGLSFDSSLAVDGQFDKDGDLHGHCSHTSVQNTSQASWLVDFGSKQNISGIIVYNRKSVGKDIIGSRLRDFRVYCTGDKPEYLLYTDTYRYVNENYPVQTKIPLPDVPQCSGINITIPLRTGNEPTLFSLCEVEVFSDLECEQLQVGSNVLVSYTNGDRLGSIANFSCKPGFFIAYNYNVECKNWTWTKEAPACGVVYCPIATASTNGHYDILTPCISEQNRNGVANLPYGCMIQPVCDVGYNLKSKGQRTCLQNGNFDGEDMECIITNCSLPNTLNGVYTYQNGSVVTGYFIYYDTKIYLKCDKGYNRSSEGSSRICKENNTLIGQVSECNVVTCLYPGQLVHGRYYHNGIEFLTGQRKNYTEQIDVRCNEGYMITNSTGVLTCNENGNWGNDIVVCSPVTCPPLETLPNIIYEYSHQDHANLSIYDSYVNISCESGKFLTGSEMRKCREDGQWDGEPGVCNIVGKTEKATGGNVSVIAGAAGGGVALLVIIVVVVVVVLHKRGLFSKQKTDKDNRFSDIQQTDPHKTSIRKQRNKTVDNETAGYANAVTGEYTEIKELDNTSPNTGVYQNEPISRTEAVNYTFVNEPVTQIPKSAIPVKDLSDLVLTGDTAMDKFKKEFESLADGLKGCQKEAVKSQNKGKNRYRDLYAYDTTRVVLEVESPTDTDYINACYVDGFRSPKKFIASQGPTKEIISDFWRMIWQTKCSKIVMLTNLVELGKPKCDQYWPDQGSAQYGTVTVTMTELDTFTDFVIRKFTIKKEGVTPRVVTQFHYTAWPDKGVPKYASSLVQFQNKVQHTNSQAKDPVVVHCSAGVGRTGTYIVLDYITDQGKEHGYVDVYGCVKKLREQRVKLVQMLEQYVFIHHAAVETLMLSSSALPSSQFQKSYQQLLEIDGKKKKRKLDIEFEMLKKLSPVIAEDQYVSAKDIKNRTKNRYSNVLPVEEFMPIVPTDTGDEIYVNAVFLPSYKEKKAFIITQTPLHTTKSDLWKLVWEHDVHTIVMMNNITEMKDDEIYWPNASETVPFQHIHVTNDSTMTLDLHTVSSLTVTSFAKKRSLRLFQCGGWAGNAKLPDSPGVLLSLLEMVLSWQRQTGNHSILVHCMNGAEKSGLFCVVSAVIDRMKIEQAVAISHTIEDMRNAREQIIPSAEQYKFCHDVVLRYIQMNDTYSNFV